MHLLLVSTTNECVNYVPHEFTWLTCLRALLVQVPYVTYMPLCLCLLRASFSFFCVPYLPSVFYVPYVPSLFYVSYVPFVFFTCATCRHFLRALRASRAFIFLLVYISFIAFTFPVSLHVFSAVIFVKSFPFFVYLS